MTAPLDASSAMTPGAVVRARLAGWVIILTVPACGAPSPAPTADGFFFPRHGGSLGEGDAALLEGIPVMEADCLLLQAADLTRYLPLWPADTRRGMINSQPAILAADTELLVEVGDIVRNERVELAGSEVPHERLGELVGPVPDRCAVGRYWVVSDVLTRP